MRLKLKRKNRKHINTKQQRKVSIVIRIFTLVDAFVALGGHADKSGSVNKTSLIETIKK
jgi:hypothetical protein